MSFRKRISRRLVLQGMAGLALPLPFLESASRPKKTGSVQPPPPKRLLVWTQPNGTVMDLWAPEAGQSEADFELSEILSPFERHKADMVVVQNLMQREATGHQYVTSLTGYGYVDLGAPRYLSKGVSLDQYVAQKQLGSTPIASLELGVCQAEDGQGAVSWSAAGQAVIGEANPFKVYARIMGGGLSSVVDQAEAKRLLARRHSIIDTVKDPLSSLTRRLGGADRAIVDNYLESVRGVERELSAFEAKLGTCRAPDIGPDPSVAGQQAWWQQSAHAAEALALQRRLAVTALACDITRVVTLTVAGSSGGGRTFDYIDGVSPSVDWHTISHQVAQGDDQGLRRIERWHAEQLASLLDDLKAVQEPGGGSLLSNMLLLTNNEYGCNGPVSYLPPDPSTGTRDNLTHSGMMMPYLIFGQCGGAIKTGRNLVLPFKDDSVLERSRGEGFSHTRLLVSVLNALGYEDTTFGDPAQAEGTVPGLLS
jgi:hypothetical protein